MNYILTAFFIVIGFILYENIRLYLCKKTIPIRIQVNGTRGKSETVRLVHAALTAMNYRVLGKTTGTVPYWILPGGSFKKINRIAPANIQEQYKLIYKAKKMKCNAVVAECMAVNPEFQSACARIVQPDITILTNAYTDHVQEIGENEVQTLKTLLLSIPQGSRVVVGDISPEGKLFLDVQAVRKDLQLYEKDDSFPVQKNDFKFNVFEDNIRTALKTVELLGGDLDASYEGMKEVSPEVGSFKFLKISNSVILANAFAANDLLSTEKLFEYSKKIYPDKTMIGLFNPRDDRQDRTLCFESFLADGRFKKLLSTHRLPSKMGKNIEYTVIKDVRKISELIPQNSLVFGFGNIRDISAWLMTLEVER
ncbi:MAG TPA: poly-gamma-glutamate synthase PgsB [Petrotogaceae bacterium]|nr:poly-gamma-glutamate synthase PgsB [Petrotogaceae bacterium]HNY36891.1 poly-gamma-glutamate synthase PgsB [Petrotogaceae bacterium]